MDQTQGERRKPALVVLSQSSVAVARHVMTVLPEAQLYGLENRTTGVDVSFEQFGLVLRELFKSGRPIIGFCATGILIRTLAPLLSDKRQEPPVLAIAEDGTVVVPLLGGLQGVNTLARQIADHLGVQAAITTTGDLRFGVVLEDPPPGYRLANPEHAKGFMSDLLAGATVRLEGAAPWLRQSHLPFQPDATRVIQVTEYALPFHANCLVYHPATLAVGLTDLQGSDPEEVADLITALLVEHRLSTMSLAAIFVSSVDTSALQARTVAQRLQVPLRFLNPAAPPTLSAPAIALAAAGTESRLVAHHQGGGLACAITRAAFPLHPGQIGHAQGQLSVIGTGPGTPDWMSPEVRLLVEGATDLVGYARYLDLLGPLAHNKQRHESDNRKELDRAREALDLAALGRSVVVVSSGDPGIFAMAAAVFEVLEQDAHPAWQTVQIRVCPGISAMQAAAARLGAPLGHDFCVMSLSDILKPWSVIETRLRAAAQGDFVLAIYNPVSKQRKWQLERAKEILIAEGRSPETLVILARNIGRPGEATQVLALKDLSPTLVDMRTLVMVGSSKTRSIPRADGGVWVYTPRFYEV
jgi:cobalt-precorrin 5A hydrolase / precorrin-3B C17-methyltransferase